jgi:hypothetical protein
LGRSSEETLSEDAAEREEAFSRWLWSSEGLIERFYARSSERAKQKAIALCQKKGWYVYAEE